MAADHVGKDVAGGDGDDDWRSKVNGEDLEQPRGDQEPAADHVSRGLAIGHFIRELMVEGAASFLLVFWSAVAALMQEMHGTLSFPMVCLVVALTVGFVLWWLGPAHFNPALPFYVVVQLAGSVLACLAVNGVMRPREEHFYGTAPMAGHTRLPFLMELLASAVLMVVITTASRGSNQTVGGLAIGAAVGTLGLVIGPVSGGSMNPIRTLGPAIVFGRYTSVWIYLVAPLAGMLLGALCNRAVRNSDAILAFFCGGGARAAARKTGRRVPVLTPHAIGAVASQQF
ncbi:aquaporin NIP4-1-like [Panicum miliaceum]|uniref:Aquaporin NIP4-1-like n=1 Tax=Panicum miliaceum TaxID=4540 RepID=A0A3L6R0Y4_PANMI|nr:aquaporin NIP4-1-like [Panicum miliaceum]